MKLNFACKSCGRSRVARAEPCHWSEGYVGMSLQARRSTMQVMLGVSLRARWDATLVHTTQTITGQLIAVIHIKFDKPANEIAQFFLAEICSAKCLLLPEIVRPGFHDRVSATQSSQDAGSQDGPSVQSTHLGRHIAILWKCCKCTKTTET